MGRTGLFRDGGEAGSHTSTTGTTPHAHTFNGQQLRHVMIEGEPWFVGVDVLRCAGLATDQGTAHHYRKLDADEQTNVHRIHLGLAPLRQARR